MSTSLSDDELLSELLDKHAERLPDGTFHAFTEWHVLGRALTDKQKQWLYDVAEQMGVQVAPAANAFSALSPAEQRRQREAAKRVRLPWER